MLTPQPSLRITQKDDFSAISDTEGLQLVIEAKANENFAHLFRVINSLQNQQDALLRQQREKNGV